MKRSSRSLANTVIMYNTRSRGRVTSAGSARPQLGMGARAPPVAASQVTPSQAVAVHKDEVVPETELFDDDVINAVTFDEAGILDAFVADYDMDVEATQPPILTRITLEDHRHIPQHAPIQVTAI